MKKTLSIVLLILLTATLFVACSSSPSSNSKKNVSDCYVHLENPDRNLIFYKAADGNWYLCIVNEVPSIDKMTSDESNAHTLCEYNKTDNSLIFTLKKITNSFSLDSLVLSLDDDYIFEPAKLIACDPKTETPEELIVSFEYKGETYAVYIKNS